MDLQGMGWQEFATTVSMELPAGVPDAPDQPSYDNPDAGEGLYPKIDCEEFDCSTVDCSAMALYIEGLEVDKSNLEAAIVDKQGYVDTAQGYYDSSVEAYEACVESGSPNCSSEQIAMERDARNLAEVNAEMAALQAELANLEFLIDWYSQVGKCCCPDQA